MNENTHVLKEFAEDPTKQPDPESESEIQECIRLLGNEIHAAFHRADNLAECFDKIKTKGGKDAAKFYRLTDKMQNALVNLPSVTVLAECAKMHFMRRRILEAGGTEENYQAACDMLDCVQRLQYPPDNQEDTHTRAIADAVAKIGKGIPRR